MKSKIHCIKVPSSTRDFFSISFLYLFISSLDGTIYVIVLAKIENAFGFDEFVDEIQKTSLIFKTKGSSNRQDFVGLGVHFSPIFHLQTLGISKEFSWVNISQVLLKVYFYVYLCSNGKERVNVFAKLCRFIRMLDRNLRHIIYHHRKSPRM